MSQRKTPRAPTCVTLCVTAGSFVLTAEGLLKLCSLGEPPWLVVPAASGEGDAATDLEASFYPLVAPLLKAAWKKRRPLRLVSVRFSSVEDATAQLEMFAQTDERRRRLAGVLDKLNNRGRTQVVKHGHQLGAQPEE